MKITEGRGGAFDLCFMQEELKREVRLREDFLKRCHGSYDDNFYTVELIEKIYPIKEIGLPDILNLWKEYLSQKDPKETLNLYVHIPFCFKRCYFCTYSGFELKDEKELERYTLTLLKYLRYFSKTFKGKRFTNLYIGGGTPSILSKEMIFEILSEIRRSFDFLPEGEKTFEMHPTSSSFDKLKIIKDFGFNRISFGVQTFNETVLELNNRGYQTEGKTIESIEQAKSLKFDFVNLDLMAGLYGETEESIISSFLKATKLKPYSISFYPLQPVHQYLEQTFRCSKKEYFDYRHKILKTVVPKINQIAKEHNYSTINLSNENINLNDSGSFGFRRENYRIKKDKAYVFEDKNELNSICGIGDQSFSYINKRIKYKMYDRNLFDPEDYVVRASPYTEKREMISFLLRNFSYQRFVSLNHFEKIFGKDLIQEFGEAIDKLKRLNAISIKDDKLMLLSKDLQEVLIHCLFLFDKEDIQKAIAPKEAKKTKMIKIDKAKSKMLSEKMEKIVKKDKYIQLLVTDGVVDEKREESFVVLTKEKDKKEIFVDDQTIVVNVTVQGKEFILTPVNQIKFDVIKKGDSLSVLSTDWNKPKALIVKREL